MRATGHSIDVEAMKETYEWARDDLKGFLRERDQQIASGNWSFFTISIDQALAFGATAYLLGRSLEAIRDTIRDGLRHLPAVFELGGVVNVVEMRSYLAAALTVGDAEIREFVASIPQAAFSDPETQASPVAFAYVKLLQALASRNESVAEEILPAREELLAPEQLVVRPRWETNYFEPLFALAESVHRADQPGFEKAWAVRQQFHHSEYAKPAASADYDGILDWQALGFGRLALESSLTVPHDSPYAPSELLRVGSQ